MTGLQRSERIRYRLLINILRKSSSNQLQTFRKNVEKNKKENAKNMCVANVSFKTP